MSPAGALLWAQTCSTRIASLKSLLDDSILALKRLKTANTNTAMVDLKKIERDVRQGYDQFLESYEYFRSHMHHSILELPDTGEEGMEKREQCK